MFERWSMGVIELERCDGNGAVADGGEVGVRLDVFDALLFMQPEVFAAARVSAGLQQVARDLRGLPRETHRAVPGLRHVYVQQDTGRQAFSENQRSQNARELRGGLEVELLAAIGDGDCDGWHTIDGPFHRG